MACLTMASGVRREEAEIFSSRLSKVGDSVMAFMMHPVVMCCVIVRQPYSCCHGLSQDLCAEFIWQRIWG